MNEKENQEQMQEQQPESFPSDELKRRRPSSWKRIWKRKWFFPAVYIAAAALILAFITWYQSPNDFALDFNQQEMNPLGFETAEEETEDVFAGVGQEHDSLMVTGEQEQMMRPYAAGEAELQVARHFFDDEASKEEQMAAMVEYERTFHPHQGVDFTSTSGESFDVLAALSGTVVVVDKNPLVGHYVEVEHENGLVTVYQSLEEALVAVGDTVQQGDKLGNAGRNVFEQELGVHVHFEVRQDGVAVNPEQYFTAAQ